MAPLKWLLTKRLKSSTIKQKSGGFTLIELLVAMILAALVLTPLLGFMVNILDTDRREQAKVNSEQETKAALDYIARDLQQSVYIYDADGISAIRQQLPKYADKDNYFPVLVFWKRQFIPQGLSITGGGADDTFVYSLVAYYLIKENSSTWSNAARIGRFQISNGYGEDSDDINDTRDDGFQMFSLQDEGELKTKMNNWTKKADETYTQQVLTLVDYIDQTKINATSNLAPTCPNTSSIEEEKYQLIPKFAPETGDSVANGEVATRGFYVCVNSKNTVAEVYIRGNALARIQNNNLDFNDSKKTYFPQTSTRVQGRGFLFTK